MKDAKPVRDLLEWLGRLDWSTDQLRLLMQLCEEWLIDNGYGTMKAQALPPDDELGGSIPHPGKFIENTLDRTVRVDGMEELLALLRGLISISKTATVTRVPSTEEKEVWRAQQDLLYQEAEAMKRIAYALEKLVEKQSFSSYTITTGTSHTGTGDHD